MAKNKRPAKYRKWLEADNLTLLKGWAREGKTDEEVAAQIGVARSTLSEWKAKYPTIRDALKQGKDIIDNQVEESLIKRALGYEIEEKKTYITERAGVRTQKHEITIKHIPGDTTAAIFWLKNRRPERWRDRQEMKVETTINTGDQIALVEDYIKTKTK